MLKKSILKRIAISSIALLILLLTYFFPTASESKYPQNVTLTAKEDCSLYVLDKENYISRITTKITSNEPIEKIKEIINILTIKSNESTYLPTNFYSVIPQNTKIIDLNLENGLLKLNFSKEFLNTTENLERKMIEAITYSLTEIEGVDKILLFVEGTSFLNLPFSHEILPNPLTRDFGVNKVYDLNSLKNTNKTTVYYGSKTNDLFYYIPVTYISNQEDEKVKIIIEKLTSSPLYESHFISYLHANATLTNYEILESSIKLSFNSYILDNLEQSTILEEVQYMIYLSVKDTYHINTVEFSIENNEDTINLIMN